MGCVVENTDKILTSEYFIIMAYIFCVLYNLYIFLLKNSRLFN